MIYTSSSRLAGYPETLDALVERACARNQQSAISGMLWSDGLHFVQVLEGERDQIAGTMARISQDPRHADIEVICDRTISSRMFGTWAMVRANQGAASIASTAFLIGYARDQRTASADRLADIVLNSD